MDNINNYIFDFAYEYALRDATMRTDAIKKPEEKKNDKDFKMLDVFRENSDVIFNEKSAKGICREYVNYVLKGETDNQDKFDEDYLDFAKGIKECFDNAEGTKDKMTFGNIQKLMNMTVKYISMREYSIESKEHLSECFRFCHCPMDSIMIKLAIKKLDNKKEQKPLTQNISWSNLTMEDNNFNKYKKFQEIIRKLAEKEGCYPLEYDFINWGQAHFDESD